MRCNYNGRSAFDLRNGDWYFLSNLNGDNDDVITRVQVPENTIRRYTGSESIWTQCRCYKCWISLQDLTNT